VLDVGGLGDKSFNDGANRGLVRAKRELNAQVQIIEPGDGSDRAAALRMLAASHHPLIFAVGFVFTDDLLQVAQDYPDVRFAGIDFALRYDAEQKPVSLPNNILALKFREEEGSFLAGALAGMVSITHQVGFVGGMESPLIHKFSAGYRAGVAAVCEICNVRIMFAGVTPNAFKDPGTGREMALNQYQNGVDIIYHAAGATGLGVFQAAREMHKLVIGVDSDQSNEAPDQVLSSMVKRIDNATFTAIEDMIAGQNPHGVRWLGLKEQGVELIHNPRLQYLLTPQIDHKLNELKTQIIRGEIKVPDRD